AAVSPDGLPIFGVGTSAKLYQALISPFKKMMEGKRLLLAPSGPLTSLPFAALAKAEPSKDAIAQDYKDVPWLIRDHAISILPSVQSLRALRESKASGAAPKPLVGFAAPIFTRGEISPGPDAADQSKSFVRSYTSYFRGPAADLDVLSKGLRPLPEAKDELRSVAAKLRADVADLATGAAATETLVKKLRLSDYRVVYFATHGLIAGEVEGLGEPSLVLTLPKVATETDDGILTASEITQLQLNADWVVLSACNTASGQLPGAEALSGLAQSFFYAGARALLVTHWRIDSAAAAKLAVSTFDALAARPELGKAEALRSAMLLWLDRASGAGTHPTYWSPYILVGTGE
ncbi:MAG: CHAT domain-containing protein, partial [Proteobacteria bacterium]|nr:CHAT domain-containing protein [Pseudomonadota bacterium]